MVAQSRLRNPLAPSRSWLALAAWSFVLLLISLLSVPSQAQAKPIEGKSWHATSLSNLSPAPPKKWIRKHLGTKSPYPHEDRHVGSLKDTPQGYELVQLHLINRHGTRYPSASKIAAFTTLTAKLQGAVIPGFEWLKNWPIEKLFPAAKGNLLAPRGDSDLYQIGHRFAVRYKGFLDQYSYDANTYDFQSSIKSRCSQSGYGYSVGFFEGRHANYSGLHKPAHMPPVQPVDIYTIPLIQDEELAVKYSCPRWTDDVKGGANVTQQKKAYEKTFLPDLANELSALFTHGSVVSNITTKDVGSIYDLCGFEVALYDNDQTWCQLLRTQSGGKKTDGKSNFLNLEISGDLEDYYVHGPGVPFNRHLGCQLGTSLLSAMEGALNTTTSVTSTKKKSDDDDDDVDESHQFRGLFKFGHSETLMFFSSFLGLYDRTGVPLTANMTSEQFAHREFCTSKFSTFASNMAFEVYRPRSEGAKKSIKSDTPKGLIRLLVNEEPVIIPGCGSDYFCEWATFKEALTRAGAGCDFQKCCTALGAGVDPNADVCLSVEPVA
ncbi:histidine phosphatase superfamily [Dissophora ornata]|nr:PHOsphatase [Dissophora ornata]KAI8606415.1 histidine phosphatase superfamily [Dissophora ornata]